MAYLGGADRCIAKLGRLDKAVRGPIVRNALLAAGQQIVNVAKQTCPGPGNTITPRDSDRQPTGNLRRSINCGGQGYEAPVDPVPPGHHPLPGPTVTPAGATVLVGTNVEYGVYVEFGTYKMRARPYLMPAFEKGKIAAIRDFAKATAFQVDAVARGV